MLDQNRLKNKFIAAFGEQDEQEDWQAARDRICTKMAKAIVEEIKELKINYTNGLAAPNGPVTGTLNHTVS